MRLPDPRQACPAHGETLKLLAAHQDMGEHGFPNRQEERACTVPGCDYRTILTERFGYLVVEGGFLLREHLHIIAFRGPESGGDRL